MMMILADCSIDDVVAGSANSWMLRYTLMFDARTDIFVTNNTYVYKNESQLERYL